MRLIVGLILVVVNTSVMAANRPNIIFIFTDDHGWPDLGAQGILDDVKTPHTDQLAARGVRLTAGYATAPQCRPSRAGLLTGRFQSKFGLEANGDAGLPWSEYTIAERLADAGYVTGMSGKWHLDGPVGSNGERPDGTMGPRLYGDDAKYSGDRLANPGMANNHGFKEYLCGSLRTYLATHDADGNDLGGHVVHVNEDYRVDVQAKWASNFIKRHAPGDQPFFLYVPLFAPHVPLHSPEHYQARFPGEMPRRRRVALGMIAAIDDGVGLITKTLQEQGVADNTLIFYMADNGAPLKIHKLDEPGQGAGWDGSLNTPWIGEKGMLTEGGIRVPFVVAWPDQLPAGRVYDAPVTTMDATATAVAAAGLPLDDKLDGVDLAPFLAGKKKGEPHEMIFFRWSGQATVRAGQWKYLQYNNRTYLFDLSDSRHEQNNLIGEHPEIAARLAASLEAWSNDLLDPGLEAKQTAAAERYYDHYLDGKPAPAPSNATAAPARNRKPTATDLGRFKGRDKNKDNHLTLDEYIGNPKGRNVPVLTQRFKQLDKDRDGRLSPREISGQ
jgi:arylsulfatase A-like enzyme